jgi:tRNA modification GTPase
MNQIFDTIVALATPPTKSALAIIRLSGPQAFAIFSTIFSKDLTKETERGVHLGNIMDGDELIDQAIVILYVRPKSFTGEDLLEIMIHGSPLIAQQVIEILLAKGARSASAGEFSSRAYLNQKIDLIQAEAIQDVIAATTTDAKRLSLLSLTGKTSDMLAPLRTKIADLLSLIEVNIDYPEYEDTGVANTKQVFDACQDMLVMLETLIQNGEKGRIIKEGIKLAIIGKPNVGKSSLLNALINEEKAIVTDIAGTTRDIVEAELNIQGVLIKILDTAGIRQSDQLVEQIGIQKSFASVQAADIVLYVIDATTQEKIEDDVLNKLLTTKKVIQVYNKKDLLTNQQNLPGITISAKQKDITALLNAITKQLGLEEANYFTPSFNNMRQLGALKNIKNHLRKAQEDAKAGLTMDLISSSLQLAYEEVIVLLGLQGKADISAEIFSRFCVGK